MKQETVISEACATGDLASLLKSKKLVDGENIIFQDLDNGKLVAVVSKGVIKEWLAFDQDGGEVPTVVIRQPCEKAEAKGSKAKRRGYRTCVKICACFPRGDRCWWECW